MMWFAVDDGEGERRKEEDEAEAVDGQSGEGGVCNWRLGDSLFGRFTLWAMVVAMDAVGKVFVRA